MASLPWLTTRSSPTFRSISRLRKRKNCCEQNYQGEDLFERVKEAKLNVLKALIDRELIIQDFKTKGGFIPETYTTERINDIIRNEYGGDRVAFIKTIYERGVTMQK